MESNRRSRTVSLSLDLTGAFDNVPHGVLLFEMDTMGVPVAIIKFTRQLLSGKVAFMSLGLEVSNALLSLLESLRAPHCPRRSLCASSIPSLK